MTARDTYISSVKTAVTTAEITGVVSLPGAPAVTGNVTSWSHANAVSEYNAGRLTQAGFNQVINALTAWQQSQIELARATLQATGDLASA